MNHRRVRRTAASLNNPAAGRSRGGSKIGRDQMQIRFISVKPEKRGRKAESSVETLRRKHRQHCVNLCPNFAEGCYCAVTPTLPRPRDIRLLCEYVRTPSRDFSFSVLLSNDHQYRPGRVLNFESTKFYRN